MGDPNQHSQPVAMKETAPTVKFEIYLIIAVFFAVAASAGTNVYSLVYSPSPANNPLKGFMPYTGSYISFPYSIEWSYLPLRSLMVGPTNFDWSSLDDLLSTDSARSHQTIFRVYLDYPTEPTGIPQYLLDDGLATYSYDDYGNNGESVCPDYGNPLLDQALTNFIAALGSRYDGDPRIGFIELGLLGYWGEWHTYPETNWFASIAVQNEVLVAYSNAFHKTKLLVRWPAGSISPGTLPIGYHDDSFAYDTIAPPGYNFLGLLATAGELDKWMTQPIGGEVRPEVQSCMWDTSQTNCVPAGQEFSNCVAQTHASWMLNQDVFDPGFTGAEQNLALAGARQMGYEFYITNAALVDASVSGPLNVSLQILNRGVAPFYYNWPVQLGVLNSNSTLVQNWTTPWRLSSLLPGTNTVLTCTQSNHQLSVGRYKLLMQVPNPMTNGAPVKFADQSQDADLSGWLTLGQFSVLPAPPTLTGIYSPFGFILQANSGSTGSWCIQESSNLLTWTLLITTNVETTQWSFTDKSILPAQFYRLMTP